MLLATHIFLADFTITLCLPPSLHHKHGCGIIRQLGYTCFPKAFSVESKNYSFRGSFLIVFVDLSFRSRFETFVFIWNLCVVAVYIFGIMEYFWPCPWDVEVPGPEIECVSQQRQCHILNLLAYQGTPMLILYKKVCRDV